MGGVGGEGGSVFSGAAGDRGLLAGCAGHGGGGRGGRSFSGGGGAVGPTRWVTRAVTVPVQLAACAVRPPICAGRKGSPRPGLLDRLRNPGSLPLHQSGIAPLFRLVFLPREWERPEEGTAHHPATCSPLLRLRGSALFSRRKDRPDFISALPPVPPETFAPPPSPRPGARSGATKYLEQ